MRDGYFCHGIVNTDANGVGLIKFNGPDVSAKITGVCLTVVKSTASAVKNYNAYVVSIAYSAGVNTITIQANEAVDSGAGATDIAAYDGDVHYSFFVSDKALLADMATSDVDEVF